MREGIGSSMTNTVTSCVITLIIITARSLFDWLKLNFNNYVILLSHNSIQMEFEESLKKIREQYKRIENKKRKAILIMPLYLKKRKRRRKGQNP